MRSFRVSEEVTLGHEAPPPSLPQRLTWGGLLPPLGGTLAISALFSLQSPVLWGLLLGQTGSWTDRVPI